jgi:hypothetical protein
VIEGLRAAARLGWDLVRRPLETWRNCEALAEFEDALEAEFSEFCRARGLDPEAEESKEAWWGVLDEMLSSFASARSQDPEASATHEAFELASEDYGEWCERSGRSVFEEGLFEEWLGC